jgi:hypothetical protein
MGLLGVSFGFAIAQLKPGSDGSQKVTFEECEKAGGTAWRVDLYPPHICQACAEYRTCEEKKERGCRHSSGLPAGDTVRQVPGAELPLSRSLSWRSEEDWCDLGCTNLVSMLPISGYKILK